MGTKNFKNRQKARYYALQALYGWHVANHELSIVEDYILENKNLDKIDLEYFKKILTTVVRDQKLLDQEIKPYLKKISINELTIIELNILRIAVFEMKNSEDIPYKVILNEAIELSKKFGATDSYKFINGVLDKIAKKLRKEEF